MTPFPIVELPPIEKSVLEVFNEQLAEARGDFNFLWQHQSDFKEECQFNKTQGLLFPHCSVCQSFIPQNDESKLDSKSE